ncbi:MAG: hypothetical protein ACD_7C00298G0005 [uncultured bacterium]|nr:MAG: hypothetical protein ACD_7C00298G0005 [uncultured bacterium]KKP68816.1 MAG: hypothetical protein UR66_C0003G0081 [Candidatus Moranbacteria bacterium GW2011_GWE1_35_17]KKP81603.1 MAG: hypothetical protein UR82_C0056G0003 [Candidatus Moranbacteria bacterium GW2011_GWF1_35_5]HBR78961.1 hypothetical protein [Candidatus Moranbacteria bacterium]
MDTKEIKKVVNTGINKAKKKGVELEGVAMKEINKIKKEMEVTSKKVETFIKKNPEKAAIIAAGIGAALGTVAGLFMASGKKKK